MTLASTSCRNRCHTVAARTIFAEPYLGGLGYWTPTPVSMLGSSRRYGSSMPLDPDTWNVVVNGSWNTAILTPDGVRRRLLRLADDAPVRIEVQIDRPGPHRIVSDGLAVIPGSSQLEVAALVPEVEQMVKAAQIATRALDDLPQTPISAAGVNFRYKMHPLPSALLDLLACPLDNALIDADFNIKWSNVVKVINHGDGVINLHITTAPDVPNILINFHRSSTEVSHHKEWLEKTRQFHETAARLLGAIGLGDSAYA